MNNNNHTPMYYRVGQHSITVMHNDKEHVVTKEMANYPALKEAIQTEDWEVIPGLLSENKMISMLTHGRITAKDGKVFFDNEEIHSAEATRLNYLLEEGFDKTAHRFIQWMEKIRQNPSYNCREQAYNFLDHDGMPLTETGNIIGYKGVRDDYKDKYSGKFDNSPGQVLEMERSDVDDNPNNGCSSGFHVGSHEYADSWAGSDGRLMEVEYNPKDIVSVPNEHGYGKLRVSKYKVIRELKNREILNNGAYELSSDNHLFDFLEERTDDGPIMLAEVQQTFPGTTTADIRKCIADHGYTEDMQWSDYDNDWSINMY